MPLIIDKLRFVTRLAGAFGNVAPRASSGFLPDEKLQTYLEVTGETIRSPAGGPRTFGLSLDYEIVTAAGSVLGGQKALIDKDFTSDQQGAPNVFFGVGLTVTGLKPGSYTLGTG